MNDTQQPSDRITRSLLNLREQHAYLEQIKTHFNRNYFLQCLANTEYSLASFFDLFTWIQEHDPSVIDAAAIMSELSAMKRHAHECNNHNRNLIFLRRTSRTTAFAAPRLFIVLPADLNSWNDRDSTTHQFRLYYMCDCGFSCTMRKYQVHLSDHPGYDLERPQAFFQLFGQSALATLEIVRHGFPEDRYHIPSLDDSFDVLGTSETQLRHGLSRMTITPLVDKAISYLHYSYRLMSPQERFTTTTVDHRASWLMRSFLRPRNESDNFLLGGLYQSIQNGNLWWVCRDHFLDHGRVEALQKYIVALGGSVDVQRSAVTIALRSVWHANRLAFTVSRTDAFLDVFIAITWHATRKQLRDVFAWPTDSKVRALHVNGLKLNSDAYGLHSAAHGLDAFARISQCVPVVVLWHHPRPSVHTIHIGQGKRYPYRLQSFSIACNYSGSLPDVDWEKLYPVLKRTIGYLPRSNTSRVQAIWSDLTTALAPYRSLHLHAIDMFDEYSTWVGRIGFANKRVVGITEASYPLSKSLPSSTLKLGTLTRLVLNSCDQNSSDENYLCNLMEALPSLHQLEIDAREQKLFRHLSTVCQRYMASRRLEVTLTEQGGHMINRDTESSSSRNCARVVVEFPMSGPSANARMRAFPKEYVDHAAVVDILYWNIDCVFGELCDQDAAILDLSTQTFPSAVSSIVVDLTLLGLQGLLSMKHVFQQSILNRLHIVCTPPSYLENADTVAMMVAVLGAVQRSSIRFLTLTGSDIDGWIRLLSTSFGDSNAGSGLASLTIVGTGLARLSHTAVLALHNLLFSCELIELRVENVELHDASDWGVILEALELLPLEELHLVNVRVEGRYQPQLEALVVGRKGKDKRAGDREEDQLAVQDESLRRWQPKSWTNIDRRALTSTRMLTWTNTATRDGHHISTSRSLQG